MPSPATDAAPADATKPRLVNEAMMFPPLVTGLVARVVQ